MTDLMAAMRYSSDHWQDSYHRLSEAHRRLQRVNQGLEDKLLRLADRSQSEKSALTEQADKLSTALTTAASAIHRLKGEKERLQQDLNIAIQLLQCNSSQYGKHKIDSLPADLQQRVQVRLESEGGQQRTNHNATKAPDVKVIRVPIPTFPPTAMVYSLNKCDEDTPDEEEVQEAEDMVSAAIMAAVLEERQKEQRHCPTCTCSPHGSSPHTASHNSGGRPSGGTEGSGATGPGTNGMGPFFSNDASKFAKGCAALDDECSGAASYRALQGKSAVLAELAKSVDLGASSSWIESKREHSALQSECNLLFNSDKKSSNELRTPTSPVSAPVIDLLDVGHGVTGVEAKKSVPKDKVTLVDLSKLHITEHFNSETMPNITVNKCICGRPYSQGTNVIDVGTQTVPSYIGESGKVRSTCIYCKGHKIRDKATKESKVARPKRDLGKSVVLTDKEKESALCSSPQLMRSCSDGESVSLMSSGSTTDSSCSGDLNSNNNASDAYSSCSISLANMNLANSSTPVSCAPSRKLDCALNSPCSAHTWDWTSQAKKLSHLDSGSPSTPNSFVSSSCESGLSSSSSPHHGLDEVPNDASMKTHGPSCQGRDDLALKRFEPSRCKAFKSFEEVHKPTAHHRVQSAEDGPSHSEFALSSNCLLYEDPEMCIDARARKAQCLCKLDVSTQCPLVQTVSTQAQTASFSPAVASESSGLSSRTSEVLTEQKEPVDIVQDSSRNEFDDLSSLEVSTDLLARLTGHFEYLKDGLQDLQEGMSQDSGIFSNSPVLNDKSIPYILDSFGERDRVQHLNLQRSLLTPPFSSNHSASSKLEHNMTSTTHEKLALDLSCKLNNDLISSLSGDASIYSHSDLVGGRDKKKYNWASVVEVTPSIHRPYLRCAPEERVVASTATASATVTSL